jgi:hypothetical protein
VPEPSHARCVPQEDYSLLMRTMDMARQGNADLARELRSHQEARKDALSALEVDTCWSAERLLDAVSGAIVALNRA